MSALDDILERLAGGHSPLSKRGALEFQGVQNPEFPFSLGAYEFGQACACMPKTRPHNLALLMPLDGPVQIWNGDRAVELDVGEVLIAQKLEEVTVVTPERCNIRLLVISFLPHFVYSLGSPSQ